MGRYATGSTGIVIPVPEADAAVASVRRRYDPAVQFEVPAHITVLFPWLALDLLDDSDLATLRRLAEQTPAFDVELAALGSFPGVAWLEPRPSEPIAALSRAVWHRWPAAPPYGGRFAHPVPHLTVADGQSADVVAAVARELEPVLPIRFRADELVLLAFDGSRWTTLERFELRASGETNPQNSDSAVGIP